MGDKQLLIVSDDFGMADAINRGIAAAMERGVVRATNFLVPAPWFEGAYRLAIKLGLPVGIHLDLTCDWPFLRWRPLSGAASLVDRDGYFHPRYEALVEKADPDDVYRELKAQIGLLRRRDWPITHIDSHMLLPHQRGAAETPFVPIVERIAQEEGLPYLYSWKDGRFRYFDSFYEVSSRSREEFAVWLTALKPGRHLAVCHCALPCDELADLTLPGSPEYRWTVPYRTADFELMTAAETARLIADCGIQLIGAAEVRD